jgi:guanosine-3',5'-bis(diphosphate) 3'-pyrophosphohydrolase
LREAVPATGVASPAGGPQVAELGVAEPAPPIVPAGGLGELPAPVTEATLDDGSALRELLSEVARRIPGADTDAVARAFELASGMHKGQHRKSGEPYLVHPVRVAHTIAQLGLDTASVVAGLLHDAVEDTELSVYEITEQFGREVAGIVDGVTKLGKVPYLSRQEQQAESFRKMLLAMSQDIRVLVVKLLDRLDNMRTLEHMGADKQERISRETMQIYAPLANRLGIEWVRRELQDLSFRYLEPVAWARTCKDIERMLAEHPHMIEEGTRELEQVFTEARDVRTGLPPFPVEGEDMAWPARAPVVVRATLRPPFRVQRRLEAAGRGLDQLSDIVTYTVVTVDRAGCYAALGQLHAHFQPAPGRFRDYIAMPRPNHYRALHTTLVGPRGERLEVQIRSQAMDEVAERGIVAAWQGGRLTAAASARLAWLRQLMDWQEDVTDPSEFIEAVKADLFADEVYVFTPRGDIFTFPKGATPIDFAFAIHTDVGMRCSGARVNGQLVPLRYRLRQGDTVEILTNPNQGPREEWLKMCVSSRARARIKHQLRQEERTRLRALGKSLVEQALGERGHALSDLETDDGLSGHAAALGLAKDARNAEGIYEAVGAGQLSAAAIVDRLDRTEEPAEAKAEADQNLLTRVLRKVAARATSRPAAARGNKSPLGATATTPILVNRDRVTPGSAGPPMILLAPCCSPVPGDPLVAFFEPGKGIVAHVQGCADALDNVVERRVHVAWESGLRLDRPVTLEVRTANAVGLLAEMSRAFSHEGVNIKQANCRTSSDGQRATNTFHATVADLPQLEGLVARLKAIEGVLGVERVFAPGSGIYPRV